jgi:hypothetical protein
LKQSTGSTSSFCWSLFFIAPTRLKELPCFTGFGDVFIRDEIKTVMMFVSGLALACPAVIARGLLTASRKDLPWQEAEPATLRVAWLRQVACQAEQAVDSLLRPVALGFLIRDLRLT